MSLVLTTNRRNGNQFEAKTFNRWCTTHQFSLLQGDHFHVTLPTKVHIVKAMVFPVIMYGYESWTIKKVARQRTDAFELRCWRRLLRDPWMARRLNQSILKEINSEYSLEYSTNESEMQYLSAISKMTE